MQVLIDGGADVNAKDAEGNPLLHEAIENNFVEIVRILVVDGNADVDTKGGFGDPVLHGAK